MSKKYNISLLTFSKDDIGTSLSTIKHVYNFVDEVILIEQSKTKNKITLKNYLKDMKKIKIFDLPAIGYPDPYFNFGISKANSEWIIKLDQGDFLSKDLLELIKNSLNKEYKEFHGLETLNKTTSGEGITIKIFKKDSYHTGLIHEKMRTNGTTILLDKKFFVYDYKKTMKDTKKQERYYKIESWTRRIFVGDNELSKTSYKTLYFLNLLKNLFKTFPNFKVMNGLIAVFEYSNKKNRLFF